MFHDFVDWIQHGLGKFSPDGQSWSEQLHESLFMWNVIEGTHVLTIMFFAGTIWLIDLRMMGLGFKNMSFSKLNDRVLPITTISFAVMLVTGVLAFIGRDPLLYYHNIWFRLKMVFLLIAVINIFWFHYKVQKGQAEWDDNPNPPTAVKLSGAISMASWFLIIIFGRLIAYDWFYCDKVEKGTLMYALEECEQALSYLEETGEEGTGAEAPAGGESTTDPAAPEGDTPSTPAPEQPAAPAQPAPGQGG